MIACVLCGGKGTRLRSVIGEHQKCAVDVGGRPWIHRVLDFLAAGGVEEIVCLSGYKSEEIWNAVREWVLLPGAKPRAETIRTEPPRGTESAIRCAFEVTREQSLLVVNGDTLVEGFPLADFIAACETSRRSGGRMPTAVRGPSALDPSGPNVNSGIYYRAYNATRTVAEWPTTLPFLDIGTPAGLAEARRRFG